MKSILAGIAAGALGLTACVSAATADINEEARVAEVHSYILLDRTGSMDSIWTEALSSVNAYARSFGEAEDGEAELKTIITAAVFDAQDGLQFDVLRKDVDTTTWSDITNDEANPRGMTPLFDAIGQIVSVAETDNPEKAVLVIMTDGMENASQEMDRKAAKSALDRVEAKGWEVVFLGAEFANFADADAVGVSATKQMAVDKDQLGVTMERLGKKSRNYGQSAESEAPIEFDEEDRAIAQEEDVKIRKGSNR